MNKDSMAYKGVLLGLRCAFCGLTLSGVNAITAPKIEEARLAKIKANLEQFYPGAEFSEVRDYQDDTGLVKGVYVAEGKGMIYNLKVTGYNSSGFTFMVAYNDDGTVAGFTPIEQNETSGFGSRCFDPEYINQILELTADDEAPLLSGATLTSSAIRNGMAAASALFEAGK